MKAVAVVPEDYVYVDVAKIFGVTRHIVDKWVKQHAIGGRKALRGKAKGCPKRSALLLWHAMQSVKSNEDHCPDQINLSFALWTREAVCDLVERQFAIKRSVWTIGRRLANWGFTSQKPMRRALAQDPVAIQSWLDEEYTAIKAAEKRDGACIYPGFEMGLRSDDAVGRSHARQGQTPIMHATE